MRRGALHSFVTSLDDQEVTVLHSCIEMDAVCGQVLVEKVDELVSLLRFEASTGVVLQDVAFDADEVATQGKVARLQFDTNAGGFEWAAPFVDPMLVVAEDATVSHFRTGMEAFGNGFQKSASTLCGQPVHCRRVGILEQCLALQLVTRPVGHAVAKNNEMLQKVKKLKGEKVKGLCQAHYVGEHTGGRHACSCTVALDGSALW